MFALFIV
jgi:hypothetical protein